MCDAEGDDISASAPELVAALTGEKEYVHFTAAEGAGDHCEAGARTLYHARTFGWLDNVLRPGPLASSAARFCERTPGQVAPVGPAPGYAGQEDLRCRSTLNLLRRYLLALWCW